MYAIGALLGALLITFLVSRAARALLFRRAGWPTRAIGGGATTLAVATLLGGLGMAHGGPPQFLRAALAYVIPVAVWTVYDLIRDRRETAPGATSGTA